MVPTSLWTQLNNRVLTTVLLELLLCEAVVLESPGLNNFLNTYLKPSGIYMHVWGVGGRHFN